MIKVILCDDHAMLRRGIRETLTDAVDIQVVGEAGSYGDVQVVIARVKHVTCWFWT